MIILKYLGDFKWAIFIDEKQLTSPRRYDTLELAEDWVLSWKSSFLSNYPHKLELGTYMEDIYRDNIIYRTNS